CACYLARAGLAVRVLERRDVLGGAAVTEEFHPGFRNSVASYTVSLLHAKVIEDLNLAAHGLRILERPMANFLPLPDGDCLAIANDTAAVQAEIARFSRRDAERLPAYYAMLDRVCAPLRKLLLETPPNVGGGLRDAFAALKAGAGLRRLSMPERRDLFELFTRSAADMLEQWFESEPVRALFAFDAVVGSYTSPYAAGSAYVLLHHVMGEVNGKRGSWGHAVGGMGAISQAIAREAEARGVELSTGAAVGRIRTRDGAATGVVLEDGTEIAASCVVANVNPKLLYLELVDPGDLDEDFLHRMRGYRCGSATFRMNVALAELPSFACRPGTDPAAHHKSGIIIAPSLGYMERAYAEARAAGWSSQPIIEMLIPSTVDDSLAPPGAHVASLFCQHFAPELPGARSWDEARAAAAETVIDTVNRLAPNFRASIIARQVLSPLDLEREFGLTGGDIFHGALGLDQLWSARPVLGFGNYRAPIAGLYLCGAGAHPGGGVTGLPGHNAAREILRDRRRAPGVRTR
ncbi:MAG: NAD(P)/FAD-dependent oxidoreductase, partial [Gammaproteobacteria bacterium]|nr:NAD(P)/FAD-dependent oxidoreductase [Gammaproteobacteria bacterium]